MHLGRLDGEAPVRLPHPLQRPRLYPDRWTREVPGRVRVDAAGQDVDVRTVLGESDELEER
jgi:hypothetical protein